MSTRHTLSVLVENKPGVLTRVSALFARRAFNIHSLAVGETEDPALSRITVVVDVEDIVGVVLCLDPREARMVGPSESRNGAVLALVAHEVEIGGARRPRLEQLARAAHPGARPLVVRRVRPEAEGMKAPGRGAPGQGPVGRLASRLAAADEQHMLRRRWHDHWRGPCAERIDCPVRE